MSDVLIKIKKLSKKFHKNYKSSALSGIKRALLAFTDSTPSFNSHVSDSEFLALDSVDLEIKRGDVVGLLGKNGAGKSTLLKHIGGIYMPDEGELSLRGHLEALIELGAGFHPLLTGRENIRQRIAMLNLDEKSLKIMEEEIIEFSAIGDFIDMPFKNYSSGMQARVGFASAVLTKPDVLLVDEVLSVGDFEFQQKCLAKMNELKSTTAIVLVSHNIQTLAMFCNRGIVLEKGRVVKDGNILDCINHHMKSQNVNGADEIVDLRGSEFINKDIIKSFSCDFENSNGDKVTAFYDEDIFINVNVEFLQEVESSDLIFGIPVWFQDGVKLTSINSDKDNLKLNIQNSRLKFRIRIANSFNTGHYLMCFALVRGVEFLFRYKLPVITINKFHPREHGYFTLHYETLQE